MYVLTLWPISKPQREEMWTYDQINGKQLSDATQPSKGQSRTNSPSGI